MKKVNIKKPVYAMATTDGNSAEIIMYGTIYEQRPTDFEGNPIEGQFILLDEFLEDLDKVAGCKDITIRMDSYGGDAGVSNTIHNRLRELARGGATVRCVVDGVAMSGGSLIMCACDPVEVNPSSIIMVHRCWSFLFGGYNANELRKQAAQQDAWDDMQAEIYSRKTGKTKAEVLALMDEPTYMVGRDAVAHGFADTLIEDAEPVKVAASADGRTLYVKGHTMHLAPGQFAPDSIPTVTPVASAAVETNTKPAEAGEEGGSPMPMTLAEFREQNPEAAAELEAEVRAAVEASGTPATPPGPAATTATPSAGADDPAQAERARIQEIDAVSHLFPSDVVEAAKYGDHPCTAQEMVYQVAVKAAKTGGQFLAALEADTAGSGAQGVSAAPSTPATPGASGDGTKTDAQKKAEASVLVKGLLGKKKEE